MALKPLSHAQETLLRINAEVSCTTPNPPVVGLRALLRAGHAVAEPQAGPAGRQDSLHQYGATG